MNGFGYGEPKRGDVYFVEGEKGGIDVPEGRPLLIISNDVGNLNEKNTLVVCLSVSSRQKNSILSVRINVPGRTSWVRCSSFSTIPKSALGKYMYTLTDYEMTCVERGVYFALSLGSSQEEKTKHEEIIEALTASTKRVKEESLEVAVERDLYKNLYKKALDMLVEKKWYADADLGVDVEKVVESEIPSEVKVDINSCTGAELRSVGCTPEQSLHIIANRPYKAVSDLKAITGMTAVTYRILEKKLCCVPVDVETKVNINTATWKELVEVVGLCEATARQIVSYRKKVGRFDKVEDLTIVPRFGERSLKKYGSRLEV